MVHLVCHTGLMLQYVIVRAVSYRWQSRLWRTPCSSHCVAHYESVMFPALRQLFSVTIYFTLTSSPSSCHQHHLQVLLPRYIFPRMLYDGPQWIRLSPLYTVCAAEGGIEIALCITAICPPNASVCRENKAMMLRLACCTNSKSRRWKDGDLSVFWPDVILFHINNWGILCSHLINWSEDKDKSTFRIDLWALLPSVNSSRSKIYVVNTTWYATERS